MNNAYNIHQLSNQVLDKPPEITKKEVTKSLSEMKNNKAPGEEDIATEAVTEGDDELLKAIHV